MLERNVKKMEEIAVLLGLVASDLKEIYEELKAASAASPKPREAEAEGELKIEVQEETEPLTLGKAQSMLSENLLSKLYNTLSKRSIFTRTRTWVIILLC